MKYRWLYSGGAFFSDTYALRRDELTIEEVNYEPYSVRGR